MIVATLAMITALGSCAAEPDVDPSAAQAWLSEQSDVQHAGDIGSVGGVVSTGHDEAAATTGENGITLTYPADDPQSLSGMLAGCFGGGTATVSWHVTGTAEATSGSAELACDGTLHELEPQSIADVTIATADATSHDPGSATWFAVFIGD